MRRMILFSLRWRFVENDFYTLRRDFTIDGFGVASLRYLHMPGHEYLAAVPRHPALVRARVHRRLSCWVLYEVGAIEHGAAIVGRSSRADQRR